MRRGEDRGTAGGSFTEISLLADFLKFRCLCDVLSKYFLKIKIRNFYAKKT